MKWDYWIALYVNTHCTARGLRVLTIRAYEATLKGFRQYARERWLERGPDQLSACDILQYLEHLRKARDNGASALNRQTTVLRNFYRAVVAMGHRSAHETGVYLHRLPGRAEAAVELLKRDIKKS